MSISCICNIPVLFLSITLVYYARYQSVMANAFTPGHCDTALSGYSAYAFNVEHSDLMLVRLPLCLADEDCDNLLVNHQYRTILIFLFFCWCGN